MPSDTEHMRDAIGLGARALGTTMPNPAVGCVIVAPDGEVVARGATARGGRPHAETAALAIAGERAHGGTAYVSLEPCAHRGQTGPCADALIAVGIGRVVSALEDPDTRVAGRGHERLRNAGVLVEVGLCADEARAANIGFITRVTTGKPFVQLKLALSADGMIAARQGVTTPITGAQARRRAHEMRAAADAILVGKGTWATDDPMLTVRTEGFADRSPIRVVLDTRGELPPHARLLETASDVPLWIVVGDAARNEDRARLEAAGARVMVGKTDNARIDLGALLSHLADVGVTRLFVEGGAAVAESLLRGGLVDELILFAAEKTLGAGGVPAFGTLTCAQALEGFDLASKAEVGADRLAIYRKA